MSTTVGELNIKLNLELQRLDAQISQANAKIKRMSGGWHSDISKAAKGMSSAFASMGIGLSVGAVIGFVKSLINLGSNITDLSAAADMSTQTFQKISVSAMDAGVSMEMVSKASESLRSQLQEASANGALPLNAALAKVHLTAAGLKSLKPEDQWAVLGDKLVHAADKQAAMNLVSDLFGTKIGPKLRSTLIAISQGIDSIDTEGLIIKDGQLKKLDEAGDRIDRWVHKLEVGAVNFVDDWSYAFEVLGAKTDKFVNKNYDLRKGSFAAELFRNSKQDISHGANLLPGGTAGQMPQMPRGPTPAQQREAQMAAGAKAARAAALKANPFLEMEEAKARKDNLEKYLHLMFDDIDQASKDNPIKMKKEDLGSNVTPTDSFARIGLMTGAVANPEMKTQTGYLKSINAVLDKINSGIRDTGVGFAN